MQSLQDICFNYIVQNLSVRHIPDYLRDDIIRSKHKFKVTEEIKDKVEKYDDEDIEGVSDIQPICQHKGRKLTLYELYGSNLNDNIYWRIDNMLDEGKESIGDVMFIHVNGDICEYGLSSEELTNNLNSHAAASLLGLVYDYVNYPTRLHNSKKYDETKTYSYRIRNNEGIMQTRTRTYKLYQWRYIWTNVPILKLKYNPVLYKVNEKCKLYDSDYEPPKRSINRFNNTTYSNSSRSESVEPNEHLDNEIDKLTSGWDDGKDYNTDSDN